MKLKLLKFAVLLSIVVWSVACSKEKENPVRVDQLNQKALDGAVVINAKISKGTRFIVYCNDIWSAPQQLPVVENEWHQYRFTVPAHLTSFRMDPSELNGVTVLIRSIRLGYAGQPERLLPLTDLPKFLKYHTNVSYDSPANQVVLHSQGTDMYIMSTVAPATYPIAPAGSIQ